MNKVIMNHTINRASLLLFWLMIPYSFLNLAYSDSFIGTINKVVLLGLLVWNLSSIRIILNQVNTLFILSMVYMCVSSVVSTLTYDYSSSALLRELLYEVAPILCFFIGMQNDWIRRNIYKLFVVLMMILIISNIPFFIKSMPVPVFASVVNRIRTSIVGYGFGGFIGVIGMGFLSQLGYSCSLFDVIENRRLSRILIFVFLVVCFLTFQRSPLIGIVVSTFIYLILSDNTVKKTGQIITLFIICCVSLFILLTFNFENVLHFSLDKYIANELTRITNFGSLTERNYQYVITNENLIEFLFGKGMGTFSPNNPDAIMNLSDACYFRMLNEQGVVGMTLFFLPLCFCAIKYWGKRRWFALYFVLFSLISFFFNRTIWSIPSAYVFYLIIGREYYIEHEQE